MAARLENTNDRHITPDSRSTNPETSYIIQYITTYIVFRLLLTDVDWFNPWIIIAPSLQRYMMAFSLYNTC